MAQVADLVVAPGVTRLVVVRSLWWLDLPQVVAGVLAVKGGMEKETDPRDVVVLVDSPIQVSPAASSRVVS